MCNKDTFKVLPHVLDICFLLAQKAYLWDIHFAGLVTVSELGIASQIHSDIITGNHRDTSNQSDSSVQKNNAQLHNYTSNLQFLISATGGDIEGKLWCNINIQKYINMFLDDGIR